MKERVKKMILVFFVVVIISISVAIGIRMTKFAAWGEVPLPIFPVKCYPRSSFSLSEKDSCFPFFSSKFWKKPNFSVPMP